MKLFVVSDIHGFYDILVESLSKAGFDKNNPNHLLICCGDYWDRGNQPLQVMNYLMSLDNVILVKGNHEDLMEDLLTRGYAESYDITNGTQATMYNLLTGIKENRNKAIMPQVKEFIKPFYNRMINYFETKNYVFVHGWIPVKYVGEPDEYTHKRNISYNVNWRKSNDIEWETSRWTNGIDAAFQGIIIPDKTIVCGHWHCSYGHARKKYEETQDLMQYSHLVHNPIWEPFKDKGIIAIDRCTARTKEMNILVLEDELIEKI